MKFTTLCYIEKDNKVLLLYRNKKENDLNEGKWIGVGGKFEEKESPDECLIREVREETGLTLTKFKLRCLVTFISDKWETEHMYVYTATEFTGELKECDEGVLEWVDKDKMLELPTWEGDRLFLEKMKETEEFFTIKVEYKGDKLVKGEQHMSIEKVREYFRKYNMEERIQEFEESSATVELAAKAVNCEPKRIAKTLSFKVEDNPILIVVAGDAKIDNAKYKAEFSKKAKMLTYEEVLEVIGHPVGGVCPFAINEGVTVYLDESLKRFETVYPACGSSNSAIELTIEELEKYSNFYKWVNVCKEWAE